VIAAVAGCDLGTLDIPAQPAGLVVHSIFNSQVRYQTVLVERTLTGAVASPQQVYPVDATEAIVSDGGIPERGAVVQLVLPDGRTVNAYELDTCYTNPGPPNCPSSFPVANGGGNGAGMYLFDLNGAALVPGGQYQLRIASAAGELVTGDMVFPPPLGTVATSAFDYSRDTAASLSWSASPQAPAYELRVQSPYGVWLAFTDSDHARLSGALRQVNLANLPHLFLPGFSQQVTVSAVDANVYDYYRTSTNSATGRGIVSRLHGALGVFGGIVTVNRQTLRVTAPITRPVEGLYQADTTQLGYLYGPLLLTLYVESPSSRAGQGDLVTAATQSSLKTTSRGSAIGTLTGSHLNLVILNGAATSLADTLEVLTADIRGDTIIGHYKEGAPARFVKR
jgi:hypothetical protein